MVKKMRRCDAAAAKLPANLILPGKTAEVTGRKGDAMQMRRRYFTNLNTCSERAGMTANRKAGRSRCGVAEV